jgi:signal transduction histidine kinase
MQLTALVCYVICYDMEWLPHQTEIRTPMNGVVAIAEELNNTPLTGEQRGMLDIIRSSADAMMRLINDILLFSKVFMPLLCTISIIAITIPSSQCNT